MMMGSAAEAVSNTTASVEDRHRAGIGVGGRETITAMANEVTRPSDRYQTHSLLFALSFPLRLTPGTGTGFMDESQYKLDSFPCSSLSLVRSFIRFAQDGGDKWKDEGQRGTNRSVKMYACVCSHFFSFFFF